MDQTPDRSAELARIQVLYRDAVEVLIPAARLSYERMQLEATAFLNAAPADQIPLRVALVSDAAAFIGGVQRLRLVVARLGGDRQLRLAKKAFESAIQAYEPARHHFEHLDEQIPRIASSGQGAFGGISWWSVSEDGNGLWTGFIPGTAARSSSALHTRVPSEIRGIADHFWFVVAGEPYHLTAAYDALQRLDDRLNGRA